MQRIFIARHHLRIAEALGVVTHRDGHAVGNETFLHQTEREVVDHLFCHHTRFLERVWRHEHLPVAQRIALGAVSLHHLYRARLPAPGMIDEQLGIHSQQLIYHLLVHYRTPRHLAHRVHPPRCQTLGNAMPHTPEIGDGTMIPQLTAVRHLVELGYSHPVGIGRHVLGNDVHRHLAQIHVRADARRGCYARSAQHVANHLHGEFVRSKAIRAQIVGGIDKHLVNGIHMDILGSNVFQIDIIYPRAEVNVVRHPRRGYQVVDHQFGMSLQLHVRHRLPLKASQAVGAQPFGIHLAHPLHHLKQPWPPTEPVSLHRRRHSQAYRLLRATGISHDKIGGERVKSTLNTLHRRIKRLQVDGYICAIFLCRRHNAPFVTLSTAKIQHLHLKTKFLFRNIHNIHSMRKKDLR